MQAASKTRRRFFPWLLPFILLAGLCSVYFSVWHGSDTLISFALSRTLGAPVELTGIRWDSLRRLRFQKALLSGPDGGVWVRTGPGSLRWDYGLRTGSVLQIYFSDALIAPVMVSGFLGRSAPLSEGFLSRDLGVDKAGLEIRRSGSLLELRLRSLEARDFQAQGGFRWNGRVLDTAHLVLQVSPSLLKEFPGDWVERLPVNALDQRILKCSFHNRQLTLFGRSGPMLRATWEMAYTTPS